jgi:molybdopterin-binding protein
MNLDARHELKAASVEVTTRESTADIGFADGALTAPMSTPTANELKMASDVKVYTLVNVGDVLTGIN